MNRVVLVGRLTRDPDLRYTPNGVAVATFTVAVNRPFKNQQGEQEADFINCVAWRKQAENLANYMRKGSLVGVDGRVQTRSYDNQEGRRVYVTEILAESVYFLESRGSSQQRSDMGSYAQNDSYQHQQSTPFQAQTNQPFDQQSAQQQQQERPSIENDGEPIEISDDDLPF